jgi:hypothetical protein
VANFNLIEIQEEIPSPSTGEGQGGGENGIFSPAVKSYSAKQKIIFGYTGLRNSQTL